jgi:hypothetical protein
MKAVPCGWTTRATARPAAPRTTNSVGRLVFGLSSKCCRSATSKRRGHECCPSSTGSRRWRWGCWRDSSGSSSSAKRNRCTTSRAGCFSPPPTGCCLLTSEPSLPVSFFFACQKNVRVCVCDRDSWGCRKCSKALRSLGRVLSNLGRARASAGRRRQQRRNAMPKQILNARSVLSSFAFASVCFITHCTRARLSCVCQSHNLLLKRRGHFWNVDFSMTVAQVLSDGARQ